MVNTAVFLRVELDFIIQVPRKLLKKGPSVLVQAVGGPTKFPQKILVTDPVQIHLQIHVRGQSLIDLGTKPVPFRIGLMNIIILKLFFTVLGL